MNVFTALKKATASFSVFALMMAMAVAPVAQAQAPYTDYNDIPGWAQDAVNELYDLGIMTGNPDGTFRPNNGINRAEFTKVLSTTLDVEMYAPSYPTFPDVASDAWFFDYVETAVYYGWVDGYPDGTFGPANEINRAETAKIVAEAFGVEEYTAATPMFSDVPADAWFRTYVESVNKAGLMQPFGDGTMFQPGSATSRAEVARVFRDGLIYIGTGSTGTVVQSGTLEVALSADTPAGTAIPFNATSVPFLTTEFTASDDQDVEVMEITYQLLGIMDADSIDKCWAEVQGFKIGSDKTVSSDDTMALIFNPGMIIPAGRTVLVDLVCSMDAKGVDDANSDDSNIGQTGRFAIVSRDDIRSTAEDVVGAFPVDGDEMRIADYEVTELEFQVQGVNTEIEVGDENVEIGEFRLTVNSQNNKDVELRAITFENEGQADMEDVLENVALYVSNNQVSAETIIDGDYITFILDAAVGGYIMRDGDSRLFDIRANIVSAERNDFIQLKIDNFEDVVGVEIGTAFGVRTVDQNGADAEDENATLRRYDIDAGSINISDQSPAKAEYAANEDDVLFQEIKVVIDQPITVEGWTFNVVAGSFVDDKNGNGTDNELTDFNDAFENFELFVGDSRVDTASSFKLKSGTTDGTVTNYVIEFDSDITFTNPTSYVRLVGDISNKAENGDKVKLKVDADVDLESPEYVSTGDSVLAEDMLGTAISSFVEVQDSQLDIDRSDSLADSDSLVAGSTGAAVLQFTLDNNNAGDVEISSITIKALATGAALTNITDQRAAQFVNGKQVSKTEDPNSNGVFTFTGLDVKVESGEQVEFTLVVDLDENMASQATAGTTVVDPIEFSLAKDVTADDQFFCLNATAANMALLGQDTAAGTAAALLYDDGATAPRVSLDGDRVSIRPMGGLATTGEVRRVVEWTLASNAFVTGSTSASPVTHDCNVNPATPATGKATYAVLVTQTQQSNPVTFTNDHFRAQEFVGRTDYTFTYVGPATINLFVEDASDFIVGEQVTIGGVTAPAGGYCVVSKNTASSPDELVLEDCNTPGTATAPVGAITTATTITMVGSTSKIRYIVTAVEANNETNGDLVDVIEDNLVLTSLVDETSTGENEDCDLAETTTSVSASNYLCGAVINILPAGQLTVTTQTNSIYENLLVQNEMVEVLQVRFNAFYDRINIEDLFFENDVYTGTPVAPFGAAAVGPDEVADFSQSTYSDVDNVLSFFLYDEAGVLIEQAEMGSDGKLHFDLDNDSLITIEQDDYMVVSVRAEVKTINSVTRTGQRLRLSLDSDHVSGGLEAFTDATSEDILVTDQINGQWETATNVVTGPEFVMYQTQLSVDHTATGQPTVINVGNTDQPVYRFTVTADAEHPVSLGRLSFDMTLNNFHFTTALTPSTVTPTEYFTLYDVDNAGNTVTTSPTANANEYVVSGAFRDTGLGAFGRIRLDFTQSVQIGAGESKTFELRITPTGPTGTATANATLDNSAASADNPSLDDSVTVDIIQDNDYRAPQTYAGAVAFGTTFATNDHFVIWSDEAAPVHSLTTQDWHGGYLLDINTTAKSFGEDVN